MSEEDSVSSAGSDSQQVVLMYRCRLCPNEEFTAAERDLHRSQHRRERGRGSGSGARRSGVQTGEASELTLFQPIPAAESPSRSPSKSPRGRKRGGGDKPGPASKKKKPEKERKIRSIKKYDVHMEKAPGIDGG